MTNPDVLLPLLLAFCGGMFARMAVRSFRLRSFISGSIYSVSVCVICVVLCMTSSHDPRLPSMTAITLFGSAVGFVIMLLTERHVPLIGVAIPAGAIALVTLAVQLMASCFNFLDGTVNNIVSPDGRYQAQLVYFSGFTPDAYFLVCLKSNSLFERCKGAEEIAGGEADDISEVSWRNDHTLMLRCRPPVKLEPKVDQWQDVTIRYEPSGPAD